MSWGHYNIDFFEGQREKLDSMQRRLQEQQERATDASKGLRSLEEMYKYFKVNSSCLRQIQEILDYG